MAEGWPTRGERRRSGTERKLFVPRLLMSGVCWSMCVGWRKKGGKGLEGERCVVVVVVRLLG